MGIGYQAQGAEQLGKSTTCMKRSSLEEIKRNQIINSSYMYNASDRSCCPAMGPWGPLVVSDIWVVGLSNQPAFVPPVFQYT